MNFFEEIVRSFSPESNGFLFMWVILGIGFFALAVLVERWIRISSYSDIDGARFTQKIRSLLLDEKHEAAMQVCAQGGTRFLAQIIGLAILKSRSSPAQIRASVEENVVGSISRLERRLPYIAMCSNISTLLGLMGTIYGLILSFNAVAQPDVAPALKTSMLANGISAAMNTTLMGLIIAVPCIFGYAAFRANVDRAISDIDKFTTGIMKILVTKGSIQRGYRPSSRRSGESIESEPNIVPMMSLMTVLIPLLLSSTEFIKLGNIEINLPKAGFSAGGGGGQQKRDLNLGLIITKKGVDIKCDLEPRLGAFRTGKKEEPAIVVVDGKHDWPALKKYLAEAKRLALYEIARGYKPGLSRSTGLVELSKIVARVDPTGLMTYSDHESVKIVAENKIPYQTIVSAMDAARGVRTRSGQQVPLFTVVSIAGGLI